MNMHQTLKNLIMENEKVNWSGKSGKKYTFTVFDNTAEFNEIDGNYIFAKRIGNVWYAIYIGEGNLKLRTKDCEHLAAAKHCGFTHYHAHANINEKLRKEEEADLIEGNPECLEENGGCNKRCG